MDRLRALNWLKCKKYVFLSLIIWGAYPSHSVFAQDNIPDSTGLSGFVLIGPGYSDISTNLVASGSPMIGAVGFKTIASIYDSPEARGMPSFAFAGEVNYTFGKSRTQLFFGNRLEDILRLDVAYGVGVRQELKDKSIVAASVLFTPLTLKFFADPFVENEERNKTKMDQPGIRLRWGKMFKTGLELTLTLRKFQFEEDKSGAWLIDQGRLEEFQKGLLIRNGSVWKAQILYRIEFNKKHRLEPTIRYIYDDREGGAIAGQGYVLKLTYLYITPKFILDINVLYDQSKGKQTHPIYDKILDNDRSGIAFNAIVPIKKYTTSRLNVFAGFEVFRENSTIAFYSSTIQWVNVGFIWRHVPGKGVAP